MRVLIFCPDQNSPGKSDMAGAFLPESRAFARHHGAVPEEAVKRFPANATLDQRRATCSIAIKGVGAPVDVLAFFCHGWKAGIQAGYMRQHVVLLARLISQHVRSPGYVLFYACEAGRDMDDEVDDDRTPGPGGEGGFADMLRNACDMLGRKVTVMAHSTTGHTTQNPFARCFAAGQGGSGGFWYVEPKSKLWPKWRMALADPKNTLRYRFWWMSPDEIADELRGGTPSPADPPPAPPAPPRNVA